VGCEGETDASLGHGLKSVEVSKSLVTKMQDSRQCQSTNSRQRRSIKFSRRGEGLCAQRGLLVEDSSSAATLDLKSPVRNSKPTQENISF
jgi:hypothetical protein